LTERALEGVKVLDLTHHISGPYCTKLLADFGAEVVKVERPCGDPARRMAPFLNDEADPEKSLVFAYLNTNKQSVTLNLKSEKGIQVLKSLITESDVLVENFSPRVMASLGLDFEALQQLNPALVMTSISNFGQTGPYSNRPGFASVGEAMGGLRYINGFPDQPPPRTGISLGDSLAGMFATQGVLMALYWRDTIGKGKGQVVDASITESCFAMLESALPEYDKVGFIRQPSGTGLANVSPSNIFPTKDEKWVVIAANLDAMFKRLCDAMEQPELADDPRYSTHQVRGENCDELDARIADWTRGFTAAELDVRLDEHGVVSGPIYSIEDIANDPHFQARDMIQRYQDDDLGDIAVPGFVPVLSETKSEIAWLGSSEVGAHNEEIYCGWLGMTQTELQELKNDGII